MNPATSGFPLNNDNNKLINEAGSLCSADSVVEENIIEEQSNRPMQRHIQIQEVLSGKLQALLNVLKTSGFS